MDKLPPEIRELIYGQVRLSNGGRALSKNLHRINQPPIGSTIRIRNLSNNGSAGRKFDFIAIINYSKRGLLLGKNTSKVNRSQNNFNIYGEKITNMPNDEKNIVGLERGQGAGKPQGNHQWYLYVGKDRVPVFLSHP